MTVRELLRRLEDSNPDAHVVVSHVYPGLALEVRHVIDHDRNWRDYAGLMQLDGEMQPDAYAMVCLVELTAATNQSRRPVS